MNFEDFKLSKKLHEKIQALAFFLYLREALYKLYDACKEDSSYPEEQGDVWDIIEKVEDLMKYFVSEVN